MTMFDKPKYKNFVAPILCKDLELAGFATEPLYIWRIENKVASLFTYAFDPDEIYKQAMANRDFLFPPELVVPAYSMMDVELPLKDYMISCSATGEYEIGLHNMYNIDSFKAPRMPDALAMLLLEAIRKGIVDRKYIKEHEGRNIKH